MQVFVKYQLFSFHADIIKNISLQSSGNHLAFSGGLDSSTLQILPYSIPANYPSNEVKDKVLFTPPNKNCIFKKSISLLKWSPNDSYLASACETLLIFHSVPSDSGPTFQEFKNYKDHPLEITALAWSPDSQRIASSSLSHRIVIRDLTSPDDSIEKVLKLEIKVLGLVWDPLDKYLLGLCGDNKLIVWKTKSFEVFKTVNLSFSPKPGLAEMFNSKREDRKIDWSPDFKYILSPSLDDKIVPVVCALDRQDFDVKFTFMGPFSSINCIKFNPVLFEKSDAIISVFAMGDNDGNISVWGLGDRLINDKPFFLFKSHSNGNELIEDLAWNAQGNLLMATTMKKYVSCILFDQEIFGHALKPQDSEDYKRGLFGDRLFSKEKIRVFHGFNRDPIPPKQAVSFEDSFSNPKTTEITRENATKTVFTEQRVVLQNGKKKIIPQMQRPLEERKEEKNNDGAPIEKTFERNHEKNHEKNNEKGLEERKKEKQKENNLIEIEDDGATKEKSVEVLIQGTFHGKPEKKNSEKSEKSNEFLEKTDKPLEKNDKNPEKQQEKLNKSVNLKSIKPKDPTKPNERVSPLKKKILKPKPLESKPQQGLLTVPEKTIKDRPQTPVKPLEPQMPFLIQIPRVPIPELFVSAISPERSLEMERKGQEKTRVRMILNRGSLKEVLWTDFLEGEVLLFEFNANFLCFYTSKSLLFLTHTASGRRAECPLFLNDLILMRLNLKNELLMLKSTGNIRVLNLEKRNEMLIENIASLFKAQIDQHPEFKDAPIESVFLDKDSVPFVTFRPKQSFCYNAELKGWVKMDWEEMEIGSLEPGVMRKLPGAGGVPKRKNIEHMENFFKKLGENLDQNGLLEEKALGIAKLEEKLVIFLNRNDWKGFEGVVKRYLMKLGEERENHKIRQMFADIFVDGNRQEFSLTRKNVKDIKEFFRELIGVLASVRGTEELTQEIIQFVEISGALI